MAYACVCMHSGLYSSYVSQGRGVDVVCIKLLDSFVI